MQTDNYSRPIAPTLLLVFTSTATPVASAAAHDVFMYTGHGLSEHVGKTLPELQQKCLSKTALYATTFETPAQYHIAVRMASQQVNAPVVRYGTPFHVLPLNMPMSGIGIKCSEPTILREFHGASVILNPPTQAPLRRNGQAYFAQMLTAYPKYPGDVREEKSWREKLPNVPPFVIPIPGIKGTGGGGRWIRKPLIPNLSQK